MKKTTILAAGLSWLALLTPAVHAQTQGPVSNSQGMSAIDADLAERVRRAVVADRNLSTYAAKINIVSNDRTVRLSGMVQNEGEKAQIASKAAAIAGQRHVVNDLKAMPATTAGGTSLRDLLQQASAPRTTVTAAN